VADNARKRGYGAQLDLFWDLIYDPDMAPIALLPLQLPKLAESPQDGSPCYDERPLFLLSPEEAFDQLSQVDWAFTDDQTGFLSHDIHPYPAKFIPQIPGTLISTLSARGELVFDPFGGSGTTALEAVRLGRRALSVDANPLSALIGRAKTASIDREAALELHGFQAALAGELPALPKDPARLVAEQSIHAPDIPNRVKWFADSAFGELCLIKGRIGAIEDTAAREVALVALSGIAVRAAFQDSETRYKSVVRDVPVGETLRRYLKEFRFVLEAVAQTEAVTRYGISRFLCGDVRNLRCQALPDGSVDLVVTSPPYGNATDYHLYHRFRLLWLGFDPGALAQIEIGSHLKHQREKSSFASYFEDMKQAVQTMARALRPGRFAALVLGESIYDGERHDPAKHLVEAARDLGFDDSYIIDRPLHATKRSFAHAGRRMTTERIVVMRRRQAGSIVWLGPPPYKLWPYEGELRLMEAGLCRERPSLQKPDGTLIVSATPADLLRFRGLAFSHSVGGDSFASEPTWQAALENGVTLTASARKDPKYATHGLHPYKGKFYPQLAKGLLNIAGVGAGATLLDPFCGSGTTLLEGYLNGQRAYGCDMHPLAAKIARAKTEVLDSDPDVLAEAITVIQNLIASPPRRLPASTSEFAAECHDELNRWFPEPVITKLNWLLKAIRKNSAGAVCDFLEVVLSSVIRDVSQQEPSDLRIRYRKEMLEDADLFGMFSDHLADQFARVEKFWRVRGRAPHPFHRVCTAQADNRNPATFGNLGLSSNSVDCVLTSPPYATALPYIDTDRLSLLTLFNLSAVNRKPIECGLIGSREISPGERRRYENLTGGIAGLPPGCRSFVTEMQSWLQKDSDAGFRKRNMPALMTRYLCDMRNSLINIHSVCKVGAQAMVVIGDNRTEIAGKYIRIPTTDLVEEIATAIGFKSNGRIYISVTTENLLHQKNAITENAVLRLIKQ
jgi:DNA modification methylase